MSKTVRIAGLQTPSRRRVDILQNELDHGRMSPMAFAAGVSIRDALEQAFRSAGSAWSERVDTSMNTDASAVHGLEAARHAIRTMERVERTVGQMDARILRRVLGDGLSLDQVARAEGKLSARSVGYIGERFRDALELLGRAGEAKGHDPRHPQYAYTDAALKYPVGVS